ncbi:MAG: T9SS type A sorting domain-containing protein, partial [Bacteroidota bacterium]
FRQEASPNAFFDSVLVFPGFDNGRENTDYGKVQVAKAYYFSTTEKQTTRDPIVLLELEQAIGNQTGWLGMAYHADSSFYQSLNMHKASYISQAFPWDSSFQYRFDSMYYHYGRLDWFPLTNLSQGSGGLRVRGAFMLEGQAGSTFFYQDSTDSSQAFTIGIGTYASGYRHYRIRQKTFFVFAQIMSSIILSEEDRLETSFEIFPNPAASQLVVRLGERQTSTSISLWDLHGRIIARWEESRAPERVLDISEISPGFYLLRLEQAGREISSQKIMIR